MEPTKTNPPAVYAAIVAVMADLSKAGISKDRTNTQGSGYRFRGVDDVYNALSAVLAKHSLAILPRAVERHQEERASKSGGALFYTTVKMDFVLACSIDGSTHVLTTYGEAMDSSDKSTNKAMSAAFKYACFQAFCIPTEADNDADAHTPEPAAKSAPKPPKEEPLGTPVTARASRDQISELAMLQLDGCEERISAALKAYKRGKIEDFSEIEAAKVLKKLNDERAAAAFEAAKRPATSTK